MCVCVCVFSDVVIQMCFGQFLIRTASILFVTVCFLLVIQGVDLVQTCSIVVFISFFVVSQVPLK